MDAELKRFLIAKFMSLVNWIGETFNLLFGIVGAVLLTELTLAGEIIDDLSTYKDSPLDYYHLAKVCIPPGALAVVAYIQHRKAITKALQTPAPERSGGI